VKWRDENVSIRRERREELIVSYQSRHHSSKYGHFPLPVAKIKQEGKEMKTMVKMSPPP